MAKRNARQSPEFTARLVKATEEIRSAFCDAMLETACGPAMAARGMRVDADTVANYERGRTLVNVARVLAYPRLRKAFLRSLCGEHHEPPATYVAKRRAK